MIYFVSLRYKIILKPFFTMKIVNQQAQLLKQEFGETREEIINHTYQHSARCAGVCYASSKTYDNPEDAKAFVNNILIAHKHFSPLAHAAVYLDLSNYEDDYDAYNLLKQLQSDHNAVKYATFYDYYHNPNGDEKDSDNWIDNWRMVVVTTFRFIIQYNLLDIFKKYCVSYDYVKTNINPNLEFKDVITPTYSVLCDTSRVIATEFNRHAANVAICGQSTRYCNLSNDKKFKDIEFVKSVVPCDFTTRLTMRLCMYVSSLSYRLLIHHGVKPEIARSILLMNLHTQMVYSANMEEWDYIFNVRINGLTGVPHPDAKDLAIKIKSAIENE